MPLLDHFHPPLSPGRLWHGFHHAWATFTASELNRQLPAGYYAEPNVQYGIEIEVAAFEDSAAVAVGAGGRPWSPPAPTQTLPLPVVTDIVEVGVFANLGGATLAGAIEFVSPSNKDRPAHRDAFVSKCAAYLQQGLGLLVVDIVTERHADLHGELLDRLQPPAGPPSRDEGLFAAAYHPIARDGQPTLDLWRQGLAVGRPLPTLPLWLRGGPCVPVELEAAYQRTRSELRIKDADGG